MMVDATRQGGLGVPGNWAAGQKHGAMAAVYCVQLFCILQLFSSFWAQKCLPSTFAIFHLIARKM